MLGISLNNVNYFSKKGIFLNHHFNNYICKEANQLIEAYEVGFSNRSTSFKKVMSEFFEREVLVNINSDYEEEKTVGYLNQPAQRKFPSNLLIFKDTFVDSCGMAAHTSSEEVIKSAFLEFFERQSFIVNYLSEGRADSLSIDNYLNQKEIDRYIREYVDETRYFNISLSDKVYVILCIGFGSSKCIGLGTAFNLEVALYKSQIEALQYFATDYSKHNSLERVSEKSTYRNTSKDYYHKQFENLSSKKFKKSYAYLLNNSDLSNISHKKSDEYSLDIFEFIDICKEKFNMNPMIGLFKTDRKIPHLKVVKVFDKNWFPHMNPTLYKEKIYQYVEQSIDVTLKRNVDYIPFP